MFDNTNPYTLHEEVVAGFTHYYVSFVGVTGDVQETEVSRIVYLEFLRFVRRERTLRRRDERHMEQSRLPPEILFEQTLKQPKSVEESVFDRLRDGEMREILATLSKVQRRRLLLYHEYGLTYEKVAEIEGCTKMAVKFSVDLAEQKIRAKIKKL